jgi:hypothetical protein
MIQIREHLRQLCGAGTSVQIVGRAIVPAAGFQPARWNTATLRQPAESRLPARLPAPLRAPRWGHCAILCLFAVLAQASVVDRIAVTVGSDAITDSEVTEEIRITNFLNNEPLDFSPAARRAAAERLVDQYLIRRELASGNYPALAGGADELLRAFEKQHFPGRAALDEKLKKYGLTADDLKEHLLFQAAAIQFTELRFSSGPRNEADRTAPGATPAPTVDEQLDAWLKQIRQQTRVEFKKEAFQ